jgi:hypothetical protein
MFQTSTIAGTIEMRVSKALFWEPNSTPALHSGEPHSNVGGALSVWRKQMKQSVMCIVDRESKAAAIVDELKVAGFCNSDISLLMPDNTGIRDMGHEKHSKAPEGTATGAGAGAVVGGALGWLAGIGALAIPGAGAFVVAGPIMAALTGVGVGAAAGGVTGGLIGLGIPEYEAKQYEAKLKEGNVLLSVHTENQEELKTAERLFKEAGAKDVKSTAETPVKAS